MEDIQEILKRCTVTGNVVRLPDIQLERDVYEDVKKKLNGIGGKWKGGKTQGFVFDHDPTELLASISAGEEINLQKDYQFFATPPELAKRMVEMVTIQPGNKVLEPSAGDGALIKAIQDAYPDTEVDCYELMEINRKKLGKLHNVNILGDDFVQALEEDVTKFPSMYDYYDVIIANPPFTKNQDIDHIRAMWKCLKPGGTIVTIASPSWTFGNSKKQTEFREWLEEIDARIEELPKGTFSESGTNVAAVLIRIDKPEVERVAEENAEMVITMPVVRSNSSVVRTGGNMSIIIHDGESKNGFAKQEPSNNTSKHPTILIKIKKAKINHGLHLEYEEAVTTKDEDTIRFEVTRSCDQNPHPDLRGLFAKLAIHLALLCEEIAEPSDLDDHDIDLTKFTVTGYTIGGSGDHEGVTLIGQKSLKNKRVMNMVTPFIKWEDEHNGYDHSYKLQFLINRCNEEIQEYLKGKKGVGAQLEFEFAEKEMQPA